MNQLGLYAHALQVVRRYSFLTRRLRFGADVIERFDPDVERCANCPQRARRGTLSIHTPNPNHLIERLDTRNLVLTRSRNPRRPANS